MSNMIITDSSQLIKQPDDAFWNAPVSRRMYQEQLKQIGQHLAKLYASADTAAILLNYIMEKKLLGDQTPEEQRAEVEEYVKTKQAQLEALRAAAIGQVGGDEPSNG